MGQQRNRASLANGNGERQLDRLVDLGHLEPDGGRLRRSTVSFNADLIFDAIPEDGTAVSNRRIRNTVKLSEGAYHKARSLLLATGEVEKGRGRGGTLRRLEQVDPGKRPGAANRETDLYEPFQRWLDDQEDSSENAFWLTKITGHGGGQRRATGEWSRPDVVSLSLRRWEFLPTVKVQLSTYELKPFKQARRLAGVYEAAAHQRRSHYSYLVVEWPLDGESPLPEAIVDETIRHNIGLCQIWGTEVQLVHDGQYEEPEPQALNDFIGDLLDIPERHRYLSFLGSSGSPTSRI
jgi:hypothetical protein